MNTTDTSSLANLSSWVMLGESFLQSHNRFPLAQSHPRAMLHDENDYPDPESFKPERYLKNGLPDPTVRDPATIVFGFGRRWVFFLLRSLARDHPSLKLLVAYVPLLTWVFLQCG